MTLNTAVMKSLIEFVNVYKQMYYLASVKNVIMKIVLDNEFLKTNLFHIGDVASAQNEDTFL